MTKIQEFQKKGGLGSLNNYMGGISGLRENCCMILSETKKELEEEES
jgi:hypothetical protein